MNTNQLRKLIQEEMTRLYNEDSAPLVNPKPVQLKNNSKEEVLGDPLDVKLNTMVKSANSDKKIQKAVGVKAGSKKAGNDPNSGKAQANFTSKKEAPKNNFGTKQKG